MTQYVFAPQAPISVPVVGSDEQFPVRRVYCVGRNYAAHAREMGFDPDREPPFFFCKPADAVVPVAAGETLNLPYPTQTDNYHYEIELVVAIGKRGSDIPLEQAHEYIWGYATGLDMTRRDRQMEMRQMGRPWEIGKAFDLSAPHAPAWAWKLGHRVRSRSRGRSAIAPPSRRPRTASSGESSCSTSWRSV